MKTIYKYKLKEADSQTVRMPDHAEILSVGECLRDGLVLWARVDTQQRDVLRQIWIRGTGHPLRHPLNGSEGYFVGTVQMSTGLVWHVFAN